MTVSCSSVQCLFSSAYFLNRDPQIKQSTITFLTLWTVHSWSHFSFKLLKYSRQNLHRNLQALSLMWEHLICLLSIDLKWNTLSQYWQCNGLFLLWYSICWVIIFLELNFLRQISHWKKVVPWIFLCFEKLLESLKDLSQKVHLYRVSLACSLRCALYLSILVNTFSWQISQRIFRTPYLLTGFLARVLCITCSMRWRLRSPILSNFLRQTSQV